MHSDTDKPVWHFTDNYPRDMAGMPENPLMRNGPGGAHCRAVCP
jgi:allantoinase